MTPSPERPKNDLFAVYPELAETLTQLSRGAQWALAGVSALLLDQQDRLVLEIVKRKYWLKDPDGTTRIGLGAIGGSLEPGESALACLQRETQEEIACQPEILSSKKLQDAHETIMVHEKSDLIPVALPERHAPRPCLMTVSANLYRRDELDAEVLTIATYWARLHQPPRLSDLFGLLLVPQANIAGLLRSDGVPVQEATDLDGVTLQTREPLPENTVLHPVWTIRSLQLALRAGYAFEAPDRQRAG